MKTKDHVARSKFDEVYRPKARSRLVPGPNESLRRHVWLRGGRLGAALRAARARIAVKPAPSYRRRCIVQARYEEHGRVRDGKPIDLPASADRHNDYIEREGVEQDGSAGRLYQAAEVQATEPDAAASMRADLAPDLQAGERRQFRFIVSPEDAGQLDMTAYVRELMRRVERDLGQPLIWGAVNHYNTAHPHAHVVVRGLDRNGREVRFDPEYMKRGFRARAEELATEWLGPRTELEHHQQLEREVEQQRYTTLDRGITQKARAGVVRHADLSGYQQRRAQVLEALGLAERASGGVWRLAAGWDRALRRMGERGDRIKQMHQAMRGVDAGRYVICGDEVPRVPTEGEVVHGRVVELGLRDDVAGGMYAMIETVRGSGYYVPLRPAQSEKVRAGACVTLRRWIDRSGRARLSIDTSRLSLERQVAYEGPTWLDAAKPSGAGALAHEVERRRAEREAFLRGRGLWGTDLRAVERRKLTERYARRLGKARVRKLDGFVGKVVDVYEAPSGYRYAVVASDREVVLLRATARTAGMLGREVRVAVGDDDAQGRKAGRGKRVEVQSLEQER
jgi:type IV secretory pathway VirD2 relaxase